IRRDDDVVVAQSIEAILDIQCVLQQVEFLIFIDDLFGQAKTVERLPLQTKHRLCLHIPGFGNGATGRITLCNKNGRLLITFMFITKMYLAVTQFSVVQRSLLGTFIGQFLDTGNVLALPFRLQDTFQKCIGRSRIFVQIIIQGFFDKIIDKRTYRRAFRTYTLRAQLGLGLRFKNRFLYLDGYGCNDGRPDIRSIKLFLIKLTNSLDYSLTKGCLVCPPLRGMLSVYKGIILFPVLLSVGHSDFDILPSEMDDRIPHRFRIYIPFQQILQSIFRDKLLTINVNGQSRIEENIIPNHVFDKLYTVFVMLENAFVRVKSDCRTVALRRFFLLVMNQL